MDLSLVTYVVVDTPSAIAAAIVTSNLETVKTMSAFAYEVGARAFDFV